jgi:hypothetical protein
MSTDNSRQIMKDNGCQILDSDTNNTFNDGVHMRIKNNCWKEESVNNWVLVADLDELPCVTEAQLLEEEKKGTSILSLEGYTMVGGLTGCDLQSLNKAHRDGGHDKKSVFNRRMIKEINYGAGAHTANPVGNVKYSDTKYQTLHYKWISLEYIIDRHNMYANRLSDTNKRMGWGVHYIQWSKERVTEVYNSLLPHLVEVKH